MFPWHAHNSVVEFQSQNRGHRNTRLCHFIIFKLLLHIPFLWFLTVAAYISVYSSSFSLSPPSAVSDALATNTPSTSYSHHLLDINTHIIRKVSLHRSIIGHVAIYYVIIFCLFKTYYFISSDPASYISVFRGGYYQLTYTCHFGCPPVIRLDTLCWNLPRARPMQGIITHISKAKRINTCTTDLNLKNTPDTLGMYPSFQSILVSWSQLFCAF